MITLFCPCNNSSRFFPLTTASGAFLELLFIKDAKTDSLSCLFVVIIFSCDYSYCQFLYTAVHIAKKWELLYQWKMHVHDLHSNICVTLLCLFHNLPKAHKFTIGQGCLLLVTLPFPIPYKQTKLKLNPLTSPYARK